MWRSLRAHEQGFALSVLPLIPQTLKRKYPADGPRKTQEQPRWCIREPQDLPWSLTFREPTIDKSAHGQQKHAA